MIATVADPMAPIPYRVSGRNRDTSDTFTLSLEPATGARICTFRPGQFNMLYVFGVGEVPISISGDPHDKNQLIHTTRKVGAVTAVMNELKKGDVVGVRGPYGSWWPVEEQRGRDIVFIAGGIGLAPLRPALYHVIANRSHYGRVVLLYGTRTPEDLLYKKELQKWRAQLDLEIHVTVDRATGKWRGNVGVVPTLVAKAPFDSSDATALVCGPEIMMRYTVQALNRRGLPEHQIYISMERNMKCGIGLCGHCQFGPEFICKDGPVLRYDRMANLLDMREL